MRRKLGREAMIELVVSRLTKGAAFNPPPQGYRTLMEETRNKVTQDFATLPINEWLLKYSYVTYDITPK